jgi:hypothetical protein
MEIPRCRHRRFFNVWASDGFYHVVWFGCLEKADNAIAHPPSPEVKGLVEVDRLRVESNDCISLWPFTFIFLLLS